MTILRCARASAPHAEFVNRPRHGAQWPFIVLAVTLITSQRLHADFAESGRAAMAAAAPESGLGVFRLSLSLRDERTPYVSLQNRARRFQLREFVEPEPPTAAPVSIGVTDTREGWDWAGLRRQIVRGLVGARRIRFERESLCVESERFNEPGRIPGVVQDAAIAAGVRARLAAVAGLRVIVTDVQCREGCVRIRGRFVRCPEAAQAVLVALAVEGVREVRTDVPDDLQREMAADR
ncbi:hypothetical protein AYO41_00400 [Verrucomicrobia bacterium SCGC AG-212-E04]|nr:hypothetical protein AYO41_00400 [Verrucomicrobia bacterium SCGC AG-212-E04]